MIYESISWCSHADYHLIILFNPEYTYAYVSIHWIGSIILSPLHL